MTSLVVRLLAWMWGNRDELAHDARELVEPEAPGQPLPAAALAHQRAQIEAATHAKARAADPAAVCSSSTPKELPTDGEIRKQAGPGR
jgi:hypothetical protein